jgi:LuxR family transcriptional regulator, regulator of acetate metabolism
MPTAATPLFDDRPMLLRNAIADLAERARFPIVFGGFANQGHVVVSELVGNRRDSLRGLIVRPGSGLGGRVLLESRPRMTNDYGRSRTITHDYDRPVLAEGITTLLAVPVISDGAVLAVLYGGLRADLPIGGMTIEPAAIVADQLAARLAGTAPVSPSVPERPPAGTHEPATAASTEDLRALYDQVRRIAVHQSDPGLRNQLEAVERSIENLVHGGDDPGPRSNSPDHQLTAREFDVLSLAALGRTNAAIGAIIGVTESTVKSYMNSTMHKLAATTRYEAVAIARRRRLMP